MTTDIDRRIAAAYTAAWDAGAMIGVREIEIALAAADAVDPVRAEEAAKARHPLMVVDPGPAVLVTPVQTVIAMDDIVHRLRQEGADAFHKHYSLGMWKLCAEAADEIERLRGELRANSAASAA